jgi:hypothetical protein
MLHQLWVWLAVLFPEDAMALLIGAWYLVDYAKTFYWKPVVYTCSKKAGYYIRQPSVLPYHPYDWLPVKQVSKNLWRKQGNALTDDEQNYLTSNP